MKSRSFDFTLFLILGISGSLILKLDRPAHASQFTWAATYLSANPTVNDQFGVSAAQIGTDILIGSLEDDLAFSNAGAAYRVLGALDGSLVPIIQTFSHPTPDQNDGFGSAVAAVGTNALVGVPFDNPGGADRGSAIFFGGTTLTYTEPGGGGNSNNFGTAVAGIGTNAYIGTPGADIGASNAGAVYIFDTLGVNPTVTISNPAPAANDQFGWSLAKLGSDLIVGTPFDFVASMNNVGSVYRYSSSGTLLQTINNPTPVIQDRFGYSVAGEGSNILVGAPSDPGSGIGKAFLFNTSGTLLQSFSNPTPVAGDNFGFSVALSGNYAFIGAYHDDTGATDTGTVYVFDINTGLLVQTITNPTPAAGDQFSFGQSRLGTGVVIGADRDNTGAATAGAAYLFVPNTIPVGSNVTFPFAGGQSTFGGANVKIGSVSVLGEATATLLAAPSYLESDIFHILRFVAGDGFPESDIYYSFTNTATESGDLTFAFRIDESRIPNNLQTFNLVGVHDHGLGIFEMISGTYDSVNKVFTYSHSGPLTSGSFGVGVNPEPATLLLLALGLLGWLPFKKRR